MKDKKVFNKILTISSIGVILVLTLFFSNSSEKIASANLVDIGTENSYFTGRIDLLADPTCIDSDGGKNYYEPGIVEGVGPSGYTFQRVDTCETGDYEGYLKEYYCNGTTPWPVRYQCELGCADGACLSPCTDADGDGFAPEGGTCGPVDCNDNDSAVNPGAEENCSNGIDDNCNGLVDDDDLACLVCTDQDNDGFAAEGGLCGQADCRDDDPNVNPGVVEICDNGIDDNCNGKIDGEDSQCLGKNTIIIGWDGTQRDHLFECINGEHAECAGGLPNLVELSGGTIQNLVITSGHTSTKPGWAQIFSGYNAEVMGIYDNGNYQPLPQGYSIFEKLESQFGPDNLVSIFLSAKSIHTGAACVGEETTENGLPVIEDQGQPYCITQNYLDYYENDLRFNDVIGNRAMELLETHQDDLFVATFIFREPDVIGHLAGENSTFYSRSLAQNDEWLGKILTKLKELNLYEKTNIYLTTDHGFDEDGNRHGNAPYTFLVSNDPGIVRGGDRKDLAATILTNYGVSLEANGDIPAVNGVPLTQSSSYSCVPENEAFYDYPGAPSCCEGLSLIGLELYYGTTIFPTGGTGDQSGFCTSCGDGVCTPPENRGNCPSDCS